MSCLKYSAYGNLILRKQKENPRLVAARSRHDVDGWNGFTNDVFVSMLDGDQRKSETPNEFSKKLFDIASSDINWLSLQDTSSVHPSLAAKAAMGISRAVSKIMFKEIMGEEEREIESKKENENADANQPGASERADDADADREALPTIPPTPNAQQEGSSAAPGDSSGDAFDGKIDVEKSIELLTYTNALGDELEEDAKRVSLLRGIGLMADVTTGEDPIDEELIKAVHALDDFSEFLDMLGKGEDARGKGITESFCNVVGVETNGDIGRLIPLELAKLRHPSFKRETQRRILEKKALCWEYKEQESSKGDFVLLVDRSYSMTGPFIRWARSLAINIIRGCVDDDRRIVLSIFAGEDDVDTIVIEDKKSMATAIKNLLQTPRGGTDFDGALKATEQHISKEEEDVDVLVITDCMLPPFERKDWMTGRLVCASIGCGVSDGFDATVQIDNVDGEAMMRVVDELI